MAAPTADTPRYSKRVPLSHWARTRTRAEIELQCGAVGNKFTFGSLGESMMETVARPANTSEKFATTEAAVWEASPDDDDAEQWTFLFWHEHRPFRLATPRELDLTFVVQPACGRGRHAGAPDQPSRHWPILRHRYPAVEYRGLPRADRAIRSGRSNSIQPTGFRCQSLTRPRPPYLATTRWCIRHRSHHRVSARHGARFSHPEAARFSIIPTTAATPAAPTD